jgi:hypothetical protein
VRMMESDILDKLYEKGTINKECLFFF